MNAYMAQLSVPNKTDGTEEDRLPKRSHVVQ